jgi:hypothetical protein
MTMPAPGQPKLPFTLQAGETVLMLARRHWAFLTWKLARDAVLALVPIIALLVLASFTFGLDGRVGQVIWLLCAVWFLVFAVRGYFTWYRYQNDVWVITDQRIVDSSKKHWFHHGMASADLDDVEDMRIQKDGLFPTAFNYGNVQLQTAGPVPNFVLSGIPKPADVMALIDRQRDAAKRRLRGV